MQRQEPRSRHSVDTLSMPQVVVIPRDPLVTRAQLLYTELEQWIETGRHEMGESGFLGAPQSTLACGAVWSGLKRFSQELAKAFVASFDGSRDSVLRGAQIENLKLSVQGLLGVMVTAAIGERIRNSDLPTVMDAAINTQAQLAQFIINGNMATAEYLVQLASEHEDPDDDPDPAVQGLEAGLRLVTADPAILNQALKPEEEAA
ncbi:MAG: hypothetical protein K1X83_04620 [Oligoflexia bacterium]|nr:hypothetical protein [Oligoflexia bacterium]